MANSIATNGSVPTIHAFDGVIHVEISGACGAQAASILNVNA